MKMKKPKYFPWVLLSLGVGLMSGFSVREGIKAYSAFAEKPALTPPAALFPVVWTVLYVLMGAGVARVSSAPESRSRDRGRNLFVIQLAVNFFWSLIFFNAGAYGFALVWLGLLWVLVFAMILNFREADRLAGLLQLPYLVWLTFAGYLNYGVWRLNG